MTTTSITPDVPGQHGAPCGPDCVYIDDACRCYAGEPAGAEPSWMAGIHPPF